jgi:hypothetical protein
MIRLVSGGDNRASLCIPLICLEQPGFVRGALVPVAFVQNIRSALTKC